MGEHWQTNNGVAAAMSPEPAAGWASARTRDRLFTTWITSEDGIDHAVTDEMMAAGIHSLDGRFSAVCSEIVSAAFLVVPPGRECSRCRAAVGSRLARPTRIRPCERVRPTRRPLLSWLRDLLLSPGAGRHAQLSD